MSGIAGVVTAYGQSGGYIPSDWRTPPEFLQQEFGHDSDIALNVLAGRLALQSAFWGPITEAPVNAPSGDDTDQAATSINATARLDRLESLINRIAASHASLGHNQGPPIVEQEQIVAIVAAVLQARDGIAAEGGGIANVSSARSALSESVIQVGKGILTGLGYKAGQDLYNPAMHLAVQLFHGLHDVIAALGHWLAVHPPLPLL